jgi:hypothetical protein
MSEKLLMVSSGLEHGQLGKSREEKNEVLIQTSIRTLGFQE